MRITKFHIKGRDAYLNGAKSLLGGSNNWNLLRVPVAMAKKFLDTIALLGHNFTVLWDWHDRSAGFYERLDVMIDECLSRGILPQVMLFNKHSDKGPTFVPLQLLQEHKKHIQRVVSVVGNRPVMYLMCNECAPASYAWQDEAVRFLLRLDPKAEIAVSTGVNGNWQDLFDTPGIKAIEDLDPLDTGKRQLLTIAHDDHSKAALNTRNKNVVDSYYRTGAKKGMALLNIDPFNEQMRLAGHNAAWNDVDNPANTYARKLIGELVMSANGGFLPPPFPQPDPPFPRPEPDPPDTPREPPSDELLPGSRNFIVAVLYILRRTLDGASVADIWTDPEYQKRFDNYQKST